jgi:Skp family chaperone for outer membrane proteins
MEPVFDPIKCKTCEEILNKPVFLPCGHSICQVHVDEAKTSNSDIKCCRCMESHSIPEKGFSLNKDLEALIENRIDSLDLGEDYNYTHNQSLAFANFVERFESYTNKPEMRIHNYISGEKNEIDLIREKLKKEIDQKCLLMIEKLEEFEKECMANLDSVRSRFDDKLDEKLNKWKIKSEQFTNDLRSFESSKRKKVKEEVDLHLKEIRSELYDFDESLFLNRFNEIDIPKWGINEVFDTLRLYYSYF